MSFEVIELDIDIDIPELTNRAVALFERERDYALNLFKHKSFFQVTFNHAREAALCTKYFEDVIDRLGKALPAGFYLSETNGGTITNLRPGYSYVSHVDRVIVAHIPLITNPLVRIKVEDTSYHFEVGKAYLINTTKTHTAWNCGSTDRIHMLVGLFHDTILPYNEEVNGPPHAFSQIRR